MENNTTIMLKTLQTSKDEEPSVIELCTKGRFAEKDGKFYVIYEESEMTGFEDTTTTIKVENERISMTRKGKYSGKMIFVSGEKLSLLGTQHILYVKKGIRNYAADSDGNITLYVTDTDDYELKYKTYITWLRSQCLPLMTLLCKRAYDEHYGKLGIDFPTIKVKDMRSRWGSCIPSKKILTFNVHLMEYPLPAAEYVVAHEFTHFLQANHSARFYAELARYMPDYKQRERLLK